jgi:hypothetical protein
VQRGIGFRGGGGHAAYARVLGELEYFSQSFAVAIVEDVLHPSLRSEDKLNDLIVSDVDMQVAILKWSVHDQTRGGLTAGAASDGAPSAGGVGERDWVVRRQTREVCICEAFRLLSVDSAEIDEHVKKLVERYNPQSAASSFVLVYYEGAKFKDFADRYKAYVIARYSLAIPASNSTVASTQIGRARAPARCRASAARRQ